MSFVCHRSAPSMARLLLVLVAGGLCAAACGPAASPPAPPPAPTGAAADHDHDHDHGHDHAKLPGSLEDAVTALEGHWTSITKALAKDAAALGDAERDRLDSAVHEAGHVLESMEGLAVKAGGAAAEGIAKAQAELFECLDSIDQKLHGDAVDVESIRNAVAGVESRVVAAIAALKDSVSKKDSVSEAAPATPPQEPATEKAQEPAAKEGA